MITHDELLKKIKTQEEYWTNLVHFTNPEFYENTVDQRNAWQALKAIVEAHHAIEQGDEVRCLADTEHWPCTTLRAIEKALL